MEKYKIKNTDLELSRQIYGCMNLSTWDSNPVTGEEIYKAEKLVNTSIENGINIFDHADIYCFGKSEKIFGKILTNNQAIRKNVILQSKCGIRFQGDPSQNSPGRYDFSYHHIINSVEGILERLKTDYLDILLLHRPDPLMQPEEIVKAFDKLKNSGKVKYFGTSNFNSAQITLLQKYADQKIIINQVQLNLLHNNLINDGITVNLNSDKYSGAGGIMDYCRLNGIQIQAWSPLAKGIFSNVPENSPRNIVETANYVKELSFAKSTSTEAIVLAWLLKHPAKIAPVLGTSNISRLKACLEAEKIDLSREEWYRLFIFARGEFLP